MDKKALLPAVLFLILCAIALTIERPAQQPSYLVAARDIAERVGERGVDFLGAHEPAGDPRLAPAALLLLLGVSPAAVLVIGRIVGIGLGAFVVAWVARPSPAGSPAPRAGGWLLAASPLWLGSAVGLDAHLFVAPIVLALSGGGLPVWLAAALLGWVLGWTPWAWVSVLLLPLGAALLARGRRARGTATVVLALVLLWLLNPAALMDPGGWAAGMLEGARAQDMLSSGGHFGVRPGFLPISTTFHVAGVLLLLLAARGWPQRVRRGDFAPIALLILLLIGVRSGFAREAPLLIALPWAAREASAGWDTLAGWARSVLTRRRAALLVVLLAVPLVAVSVMRWSEAQRESLKVQDASAWVEAHLEPGSLVLHDLGFPPPEGSRHVWMAIPFHAIDPGVYRGTYWEGWYRAARAAVLSEKRVLRYLREPQKSDSVLRFYARLSRRAVREESFGDTPGRRTRVLLYPPLSGGVLGDGWRTRVATGLTTGVPGGFLALLGSAITDLGHAGEAVELLEEALTAGYTDVGIYLNLSNAYLAQARVMEAGRVLDDAHRYHAASPELRFNLGRILIRAGMWERAARTLAALQQEWPRSAQVCYLLGVALANEDHPTAARRQIERALQLDPALPQREDAENLLVELGTEGS